MVCENVKYGLARKKVNICIDPAGAAILTQQGI
jgi:hypothetical protein